MATKPKPKTKTKTAEPKRPRTPGMPKARAMARKRGMRVRTVRKSPGTYRLTMDQVLAEGSVASLIDYMKNSDAAEAAIEAAGETA